jgi:hypothetical protein
MSKRIVIPLLSLGFLIASLAAPDGAALAQDVKVKEPVWKHAMDVLSRKVGEETFNKDTKKYGIEVYQDENNGAGVYITQTGSVAVMSGKLFKGADGKSKSPLWQHGLELAARKFDEKDFSKATKRFAFEVFKDENNGNLFYLSNQGGIDTVPAKYATITTGKVKKPVHRYGANLKVRKAGEDNFTKDTQKIGVEVFKDENNGNYVYLSETGGFAVVPAKLMNADEPVKKAKDPEWQHGLELAVRMAGEEKFTKDTKRFGIEVYLDENNGNLIYICQTGDLAVVPAKQASKTPDGKPKAPELKHALDLSARKVGEEKFTKDTKKYGIEVYQDENNGCTLYICETGDLSIIPGKEP